jgi:DNA-binding MarR family transcriptional regulator
MAPMADDVAEFIEGFALMLNQAGMQRMAARVFGALLAAQSDGLTAKQIADALAVSPAAVSGAVGYLTRTGLATRVRTPGNRVDHFVVDTTWAEAFAIETDRLHQLAGWLSKGAAAMPAGSPAQARLAETRDFFEFIAAEMPKLIDRWRESRSLQ